MSDGYWNSQQSSLLPGSGLLKRPRADYDIHSSEMPSSHDVNAYYPRDDDRGRLPIVKDTKSIGSAYDRYLQNAQVSSHASGEVSSQSGSGFGRAVGGGISAPPIVDSSLLGRPRAVASDLALNGRDIGFGGQPLAETMSRPSRETVPLPPDASNTLYVEGLPPDITRREVAHIFRPFVGYKELRLVNKELKHRSDPITLCFVDFVSPACAATAMSALQGYKMDENDPDSTYLRFQFSRNPGPRSGPASRGKS